MSRSTGPVLAAAGVTWANRVLISPQPLPDQAGVVEFSIKVGVGGGIVAGILTVVEKGSPELAVGIAWLAFLTMMLARITPGVPSPTENLLRWWNER
jgi:hypothetical protein